MERKRSKVIQLPTKDETCVLVNAYTRSQDNSGILSYIEAQDLHGDFTDEELELKGYEHQHLYFTTDDRVDEGDWILWWDKVCQVKRNRVTSTVETVCGNVAPRIDFRKISSSTDPKLTITTKRDAIGAEVTGEKTFDCPLPQPSQAFIEAYCKAGGIDEVDIEYETIIGDDNGTGSKWHPNYNTSQILKVDSHNTITIHPIKDSWSREEIDKICEQVFQAGRLSILEPVPKYLFYSDWIKQNL